MLDERLLDSDPRRDVYAQNVRAFFVNEKTRRFFVPLSNWNNTNAGAIETALRNALSGISVASSSLSLFVPRNPQSPLSRTLGMIGKTALWAALLMLAGLGISPFFKDSWSGRAALLSDPTRKTRLKKTPVAAALFLAAAFIVSGAMADISGFRLLGAAIPFALFLLGWTLPAWFRRRQAKRRGHTLFRPVALRGIVPRSQRGRPPVVIICLFAAGAAALALPFFLNGLGRFGGPGSGGGETASSAGFSHEGYGGLVSEEEYRAHVRRQAVFAYLPLGIDREEDAPPYRRYTEDADGLYAATGTVEMDTETMESGIPDYPFDSLAAFIEGTAP
jgi:hypothetical protein